MQCIEMIGPGHQNVRIEPFRIGKAALLMQTQGLRQYLWHVEWLCAWKR